MSVSLLPVLIDENSKKKRLCVVDAYTPAEWENKGIAGLNALVGDLDIFKNDVEITSIPDIWAGPKAFEEQLADGIDKVVIKWRAILAIIGLRKFLRFNLNIKSIKIPNAGDVPDNKVYSFLKVVSKMPDKGFSSYSGADTINLICYGRKPIAMVWPSSIIYPVSEPDVYIDSRLCDGKNYFDPSLKIVGQGVAKSEDRAENGELNIEHREILAKWLYKLIEKVAEESKNSNLPSKTNRAQIINRLLKEYIKDLLNLEKIEDIDADKLNMSSEGVEYKKNDASFSIAGYGSMLSQVFCPVASQNDINSTDVRIDGRNNDENGNANKYVLFIDEIIPEQLDKSPSEVMVFGSTDMQSYFAMNNEQRNTFEEECRQAIKGKENSATELHFWGINDIFTDKIVCLTDFMYNATPFPNSITEKSEYKDEFCKSFGKDNKTLQEFILPIRKKVLDFIDAESLVKSISINRESDISPIIVSLKLELLSGDSNRESKLVILKKVYENSDICEYKREEIPNVHIWPNFKNDNWKKYYVFTGSPKASEMVIKPYWSYADENETVVDANKEKIEDLNFNVQAKGIDVNLCRGSGFPSVFGCEVTKNRRRYEAGLICLWMDEQKVKVETTQLSFTAAKEKCYIGVDFGTTNSVVYFANSFGEGAARQQMRFKDRVFQVTAAVSAEEKANLRRYFFPAVEVPEGTKESKNTIRTIFHDFKLVGENQVLVMEQPLVRGNIYYPDNEGNIQKDKVILNELKGNIKWENIGESKKNEERMHAFLHQLCLQAMAEAVVAGFEKIRWVYSWPSSYSNRMAESYEKFWKEGLLMDALEQVSTINSKNSREVYDKRESDSACDYFQVVSRANVHSKGLLSIDIGGGSTDLALWDGSEQIHQCSFKMAGNDIFSEYIQAKYEKRSDFLKHMGDNNVLLEQSLKRLEEYANKKEWDTFDLELESILKYSEKEIIEGMGVIAHYPELDIAMRDIAFALGGIFYYAGSIIGYLRKTKYKDNPDSIINKCLPECYVGGNGSKLLNWACKGNFGRKTNNLRELLKDVFIWGMVDTMPDELEDTFDIETKIEQSDKPKHEVSEGLVSKEPNTKDTSGEKTKKVPSHSRFKKDGQSNPDDRSGEAGKGKHKKKSEGVVSGELFSINNSIPSDEQMIVEEIFEDSNAVIKVDRDFARNRLILYVQRFNDDNDYFELDWDYIRFDKTDYVNIFNKVDNELRRKARSSGDDMVIVEPIFIMELKEAMQMLRDI